MSKKEAEKNLRKPLFEDKYNVKRVQQCCGSCLYFGIDQDRDEYCDHPKLRECINVNGYFVDEGMVCDLWESDER